MSKRLINALSSSGVKVYNPVVNESSLLVGLNVLAKPGSKLNKIKIGESGELIIFCTSPPIEGKANIAIIKMLAKKIGLSPSSISITGGQKSKIKHFLIEFCFNKQKGVDFYLKKIESLIE